jgi:signal transduction histidine kinase
MNFPIASRRRLWSELLFPRVIPDEIREERIRFMERDVCVTIKVVVLAAFSYFLYSPEWFEGTPSVGQIGIETIRGAFLAYLVLNFLVAGVLLGMDYAPLVLVEWSVFVVSIADSLFVALLVVVTGGLESTIYWVLLFIILRNAVGTPMVRRQIVLNAGVVVIYVFAGFLDRTWSYLGAGYNEADSGIVASDPKTKGKSNTARTASKTAAAASPVRAITAASTAINGKASKARPSWRSDGGADVSEFGTAASLAVDSLFTDRTWERLLTRVLLLAVLAASCYGINVLADLRMVSLDEARESAARQEHLRSTGRLAAEIAHQLKNPLSIINNASFNLQRSLRDAKPEAGAQLDIIREEVNRSDRIITDLMGYAQLSEGRVERLELAEELESAITQALPPGAGFQTHVEVDVGAALSPLLMHKAHLREILVNLLLNAREAQNNKGRIQVVARPGEGDSVLVSVQDDGPGMDAARMAQIFAPYFTTKEKGTGLGLAIVKHNAELYGGTVSVESELGKGSRFTLRFPAKVLLRSS